VKFLATCKNFCTKVGSKIRSGWMQITETDEQRSSRRHAYLVRRALQGKNPMPPPRDSNPFR